MTPTNRPGIEVERFPGSPGRTVVRIKGLSFAAVQNAIFDEMDGLASGAATFGLPRRIGDHFEVQGVVTASAAA